MVIRGAEESELEALIALQQLVFRPGEEGADKRYRTYVREDPTYRLDQSRLVFDHGRIVAHLRVWDRAIRVRGAILRAGGIGSVLVHPDFRGQGYARALMADTERYFLGAGYDLGLLFTIIGTPFYVAQGWTPIALSTFKLEGKRMSDMGDMNTVRSLSPETDLEAVSGIYHSQTVRLTGSEVRNLSYWTSGPARYRRAFPQYGVFFHDCLIAYVNFDLDDSEVWVKEAFALSGFESAYQDLARVVVDTAGDKREIEGSLPHDHLFVQALTDVCGQVPEWGTHDEMMVKLVNWQSLTEKLGGIHIPNRPPGAEADLWHILFALAEPSTCQGFRPWLGSLEACDSVFYWWTDIF